MALIQSIANKLGTTNDAVEAHLAQGTTPTQLVSATIHKTYVCYGVTAEEVRAQYGATEFDLNELEEKFASHCKDYGEPITAKKSVALEFAIKIIFEAGPQIRNERKTKGDKVVKFLFPYVLKDDKTSIHTVFVSTFKEMAYKEENSHHKMVLTFKQAGLLATRTLSKVNTYLYHLDQTFLMTPLCGAIFAKEEVLELAKDLGMETVNVIGMLNESCCSGGHNLPLSDTACALAAAISATRKVTDKNVRDTIISKTVKQYSKKHKEFNQERFRIICMYALGGVPAGMDSTTLIETFENAQLKGISLRTQTKASMESTLYTRSDITLAPATQKPGQSKD